MGLTILGNPRGRVITFAGSALIALLPLITVQRLGDPFEAPRALAAAIAVALLFIGARSETPDGRTVRAAGLVLAALVAWSVLAALLAHPASSVWGVQGRFQGLVSLWLVAAAALVGARLRGAGVLGFTRWLALALAGISGSVIVQALAGRTPQALFGNPTIAGAWVAVGAGVAGAAAMAVPVGRSRALFGAAAALGAVAAGATGSRAAVLAVLVAGALVLLAARPSWRRATIGLLLAAAVLVAAGVVLGGSAASGKFAPSALLEGSVRSRVEIWRGAVAMIADHPAVGVGPGRFIYEFPAYQPEAHVRLEGPDVRPDQAHSHALQYAAEGGVPAAVLWLALAGLAAAAAWRASRSGNGAGLIALGGLAAYLTHAAFGVAAIETDVLGWLLGGIALASAAPARRDARVGARIGLGLACVVALLTGWYVVANAHFGGGVDRFMAGDMRGSYGELERAVDLDPMTDIYRVALSDTASYMGLPERSAALAALDRGLELEPRSYDLALARARMLSLLGGAPADVADAYREALECYPLGVTVGREAVAAFEVAGRAEDAERELRVLERLESDARGTR